MHGSYTCHAWVELRYRGRELVIDPCWITSAVPSSQSPLGNCYFAYRDEFYQINKPCGSAFIPHEDFWQYGLSHYLHEIFRQPHASVEQSVLLSCYRPHNQLGIGFNSWIDEAADNLALQYEVIRQFIQCKVWPNNLRSIMSECAKRHAG